jgi:hypothetical protein
VFFTNHLSKENSLNESEFPFTVNNVMCVTYIWVNFNEKFYRNNPRTLEALQITSKMLFWTSWKVNSLCHIIQHVGVESEICAWLFDNNFICHFNITQLNGLTEDISGAWTESSIRLHFTV